MIVGLTVFTEVLEAVFPPLVLFLLFLLPIVLGPLFSLSLVVLTVVTGHSRSLPLFGESVKNIITV